VFEDLETVRSNQIQTSCASPVFIPKQESKVKNVAVVAVVIYINF